MIHDVVEVGTPTTKAVTPISNKRHPAKMLTASVTLNKLRVNLYQGADPDLAAKLDRKSTRLNSSHWLQSRMPSSA